MRNFQGHVYAVAEQAVCKVVYKPQASDEVSFGFSFMVTSQEDRRILWMLELGHFYKHGEDPDITRKEAETGKYLCSVTPGSKTIRWKLQIIFSH